MIAESTVSSTRWMTGGHVAHDLVMYQCVYNAHLIRRQGKREDRDPLVTVRHPVTQEPNAQFHLRRRATRVYHKQNPDSRGQHTSALEPCELACCQPIDIQYKG